MRPLKYKNLGEMSIIRVPQSVIKILPHLQDVMQQLEENDRDSVDVIVAALDNIQSSLSNWKGGRWKCPSSMSITSYTSPFTNTIYQVVTDTEWRQSWDADGNAFRKYYNTYSFFLNGELITKTLHNDEKTLSDTFGEIEGIYAPWSTSPRDWVTKRGDVQSVPIV